MRSRSHRIACLLAALSLASPATALGQSAGDEQYEDPFAPETGQSGGGGGGEQPEAAPEPATPAQPAPEPAATESQQPQEAPQPAQPAAQQQLPRTGSDAGWLALSGTLLLIGGVALRVRLSEPAPRRR
jgi:LPXTG-motif cell wall-anchored protein